MYSERNAYGVLQTEKDASWTSVPDVSKHLYEPCREKEDSTWDQPINPGGDHKGRPKN